MLAIEFDKGIMANSLTVISLASTPWGASSSTSASSPSLPLYSPLLVKVVISVIMQSLY
jgi:hypothetical protein